MTIGEAIRAVTARLSGAGIPPDEARREARLLAANAAEMSPAETYARPEANLSCKARATLDAAAARRARREPLAYILGTRPFFGLTLRVTPDVLIPRPETELLVEAALAEIARTGAQRVVDAGTGSGAIAVAIAAHAPQMRLLATDIFPAALVVARENAAACGVADRVAFFEGDLLEPVAALAPFDIIVSNPPYIAPEEIARLEPEVRDYEPPVALGTHPDPLHFHRRLSLEATPLLTPGGLLAVEIGLGQADAVRGLWRAAGLEEVMVTADLAGIPRVVAGRKPAP
jgi:release factor glutamine methyltransferase